MTLPLWWIAKSRRPIFVGPFTSEVGFETLYWLPFLEQLRHAYKLDKDRLIAVTRGGAGAWYDTGHAVELFDYVPPGDVRLSALKSSREQASIKQLGVTTWETKLLALIAERMGIRRYHVLHPSLLYRSLDAYWTTQTMGMATAMQSLRFTPMPTPPVPVGLSLPEQFIAVRFYARPTWPLRDDLVEWTHALIQQMATAMPVVILRSSAYLDDHVDYPAPQGQNIRVIQAEPWRENLAIQSAILKRASAFVGTWGGMAQLAVRLGIATAAFFDRWHGCSYAHRTLTEWLSMQMGVPLFVGRPHDLEFCRTVLPAQIPLPELSRGSSS